MEKKLIRRYEHNNILYNNFSPSYLKSRKDNYSMLKKSINDLKYGIDKKYFIYQYMYKFYQYSDNNRLPFLNDLPNIRININTYQEIIKNIITNCKINEEYKNLNEEEFILEIYKRYAYKELIKFKKKHGYYPINKTELKENKILIEENIKNKLFRNCNVKLNNIEDYYLFVFGNNKKFIQNKKIYIKISKFTKIIKENIKLNKNIYIDFNNKEDKELLYLYIRLFKEISKRDVCYEDFNNESFLPFIKNCKYDKSYYNMEGFFTQKELENFNKIYTDKSIKSIHLSIKEYMTEKNNYKIAENIILKLTQILLNLNEKTSNIIKFLKEYKENTKNFDELVLYSEQLTLEEKQLFNQDKEIFIQNIIDIFTIIKKEKMNVNSIENLNDTNINNKGFDFIVFNDKKKDEKFLINYKYKIGRAHSNLSLVNFFRLEEHYFKKDLFKNIIDYEKKYIYNEVLFPIINYEFNNILNILDKENKYSFDEQVEKIYLNNDSNNIDNILLKNMNLNKDKYKLLKMKIFEMIDRNIYKIEIKDKTYLKDILYKYKNNNNKLDELDEKLKEEFNNISILYNSFKSKNDDLDNIDKELTQSYYKPIIQNIYSNKYILNYIPLLNQKRFDQYFYSSFISNTYKEFKNLSKNINNDNSLKLYYINYLISLSNEKSYYLSSKKFYKNIKLDKIEKYIKYFSINFYSIKNDVNNGITFDFNIKFKDKILYEFKKNLIKSKNGKLLGTGLTVETSTDFFVNTELIDKFNNDFFNTELQDINIEKENNNNNNNNSYNKIINSNLSIANI